MYTPGFDPRFGIELSSQCRYTFLVLAQRLGPPALPRQQQHQVAMRQFIGGIYAQRMVQHVDRLAFAPLPNQECRETSRHLHCVLAQLPPCRLQPFLIFRLARNVTLQQITAIELQRQKQVIRIVRARQSRESFRIDFAGIVIECDAISVRRNQIGAILPELRQCLAQVVARTLFAGPRPQQGRQTFPGVGMGALNCQVSKKALCLAVRQINALTRAVKRLKTP